MQPLQTRGVVIAHRCVVLLAVRQAARAAAAAVDLQVGASASVRTSFRTLRQRHTHDTSLRSDTGCSRGGCNGVGGLQLQRVACDGDDQRPVRAQEQRRGCRRGVAKGASLARVFVRQLLRCKQRRAPRQRRAVLHISPGCGCRGRRETVASTH
jgi:hypothetical protein